MWTDDRVAKLKELHGTMSANKLAEELGGGVTRNGVLGKLHRLGLSGTAKSIKRAAGAGKPNATQKKRRRRGPSASAPPANSRHNPMFERAPIMELCDVEPPAPDIEIPVEQRITTVLGLTNDVCHWPVGQPGESGFFFCGGHTTDVPYCSHHRRVAYRAPERRTTRRPGAGDHQSAMTGAYK